MPGSSENVNDHSCVDTAITNKMPTGATEILSAGTEGDLRIDIKKPAEQDYQIKVFQSGLSIPHGAQVTIRYKARSVPKQEI